MRAQFKSLEDLPDGFSKCCPKATAHASKLREHFGIITVAVQLTTDSFTCRYCGHREENQSAVYWPALNKHIPAVCIDIDEGASDGNVSN